MNCHSDDYICSDNELSEFCDAIHFADNFEALKDKLDSHYDPDDDKDDEHGSYKSDYRYGREQAPRPRPKMFTVFAPTNKAFEEYSTYVLKAEWDDLYDRMISHLVKFHIIKDDVKYEDDLICTHAVEMMNGVDSRTVCSSGYKHQKGAKNPRDDMPRIVEDDIAACNGVIHKVDE